MYVGAGTGNILPEYALYYPFSSLSFLFFDVCYINELVTISEPQLVSVSFVSLLKCCFSILAFQQVKKAKPNTALLLTKMLKSKLVTDVWHRNN